VNGEIRFPPLPPPRSHKSARLEHIVKDQEGKGCTPHLPLERYRLEDTVPVPARRGDVVCFNYSPCTDRNINTTDRARRLVRIGYKSPANEQFGRSEQGSPEWIRPRASSHHDGMCRAAELAAPGARRWRSLERHVGSPAPPAIP
jgi:hypothetical protein